LSLTNIFRAKDFFTYRIFAPSKKGSITIVIYWCWHSSYLFELVFKNLFIYYLLFAYIITKIALFFYFYLIYCNWQIFNLQFYEKNFIIFIQKYQSKFLIMDKFNYLLEITSQLLKENGCAWDRKQNFESIKQYFIDEVYELIDAIESKDDQNILEEAGDVLFLVIFLTKIAETKNKFKIDQVLQNITDKVIRRHPHVFSDVKVNSIQEITKNWEKIKKTEKNKQNRKSIFDSIPKSMPLLLKAQKIIEILKVKKLLEYDEKIKTKKEIEDSFLDLIIQCYINKIDIESLLKNKLKILLADLDKKITGDDLKALKIDS